MTGDVETGRLACFVSIKKLTDPKTEGGGGNRTLPEERKRDKGREKRGVRSGQCCKKESFLSFMEVLTRRVIIRGGAAWKGKNKLDLTKRISRGANL